MRYAGSLTATSQRWRRGEPKVRDEGIVQCSAKRGQMHSRGRGNAYNDQAEQRRHCTLCELQTQLPK